MTSAIAAIPSIVSGLIFCSRRANNGLGSNNPAEGAAQFTVAASQIYKAGECFSGMAEQVRNTSFSKNFMRAEEAIKSLSAGDKVLTGIDKVLKIFGDNINKVIFGVGVVQTLCSDDKLTTGLEVGAGFGIMRAFEISTSKLLGMSKTKRINGVSHVIPQEALLKKNPFMKKQIEVAVDYCNTKEILGKSLKYLPSIAKGIAFVLASITGYKLGKYLGGEIAEWIKGDNKNGTHAATVPLNTVNINSKTETMPNLLSQTTYRKTA